MLSIAVSLTALGKPSHSFKRIAFLPPKIVPLLMNLIVKCASGYVGVGNQVNDPSLYKRFVPRIEAKLQRGSWFLDKGHDVIYIEL